MEKETRKTKFENYRANLPQEFLIKEKEKDSLSSSKKSNLSFYDTSSTTTLPLEEVMDSLEEKENKKSKINIKTILIYLGITLAVCAVIVLIIIIGIAAFKK